MKPAPDIEKYLNLDAFEPKRQQRCEMRKSESLEQATIVGQELVSEGTKPTKYFCALECRKYINKTSKLFIKTSQLLHQNKKSK